MTRDQLILAIGKHVLNSFDTYLKNPKGRALIVPSQIPRKVCIKEFKIFTPRLDTSWIISTRVEAPTIALRVGPGEYKHLSTAEYFRFIEDGTIPND